MTETPLPIEQPAAPPMRTLGKRLRSALGYVVLATLMLVTPLFVFLPAALFHCAIRNGRRAAWLVLAVAAAITLLLLVPATHAPQITPAQANSNYSYILGVILAIGLPALLVTPLVQRGERFGRVLLAALLFAVGGVLATEVIVQITTSFSPYAEQLTAARDMAANMTAAYAKAGLPADATRFARIWMNLCIFVLPAWIVMQVALVFVLSLIMLGRLPAWRQFMVRRGVPAPAPYLFRNLSLPEWLLFGFVIGGLSPLASGMTQRIGANVLAVVIFLYLLQGLAIFRSFVAGAGMGVAGTLFAYGTLIMLTLTMGLAPLLLTIAGLFDTFFDFRHFNRKDHSDESHSH